MTALITTLCLLTGYRISIAPFSPIQEIMPKTREMTRESAEPALISSADCEEILACFTPLEPEKPSIVPAGRLSSRRLALFDGRSWLYVDQNGFGEYAGRRGVFHVKRWLTLGPKLFPRKNPNRFGSTTRVTLTNATALPVTLIDSTGRVEAEIEPNSSKTLDCWWGEHVLWIQDCPIATVSRFWSVDKVSGLEVPKEFRRSGMVISEIQIEEHAIQWMFATGSSTIWAWREELPTVERTPRSKLANFLSKWTGGQFL